jgi:hypothetical protein
MRERWWAGCCYSTSTCFGSAAAGGGGCAVGSRHCGPAACVVVSAHDAAQAAARDGRRRRRAEAAQAVGGACVELFPGFFAPLHRGANISKLLWFVCTGSHGLESLDVSNQMLTNLVFIQTSSKPAIDLSHPNLPDPLGRLEMPCIVCWEGSTVTDHRARVYWQNSLPALGVCCAPVPLHHETRRFAAPAILRLIRYE